MIVLGGSLRAVGLAEALERARRAAAEIGVTRVTELTRLDRLGVPVFAAIRPTAAVGGVCVTAGKGWTAEEARVGALMEAVEQAWAEPGRACVATTRVRVCDLLDGRSRRDAVLDLCPTWGTTIDLDAPVLAVEARELRTGEPALVPAELVFHPAPPFVGAALFPTGTNGLAAGSTLAEATLHALIEALERDALSFHNVRDASERVDGATLPPQIAERVERLVAAGATLYVRYLPNELGLPCFGAVVVDRDQPQLSIRGDGLHLIPEIALSRAITEALQCRLTIIHGGRDDLDHFALRYSALDDDERRRQGNALQARLEGGATRACSTIAGRAVAGTIDDMIADVCQLLEAHGMPRIYRVTCTPPEYPVTVVRVIVPGLECCLPETRRVGRRLRRFLERK